MHAGQRVAPRELEHVLFQLLQQLAVLLEHRKISIDDRVQQPIRQVIRPQRRQRPARPQPLAHRSKAVARQVLLKREHVISAHEDAHLLGLQLLAPLDHPHHDEQRLIVLVHLRPLVRVHHVLQRQRMQMKQLPQLADHVQVAEAIHVDPRDRILAEELADLLHALDIVARYSGRRCKRTA